MEKDIKIEKGKAAVYKVMAALDKLITPRRLLVFLIIMYVLSLIPLLWTGCYDYPSADDYTFGAACRNVWTESRNVLAVIACAGKRAWYYYKNWAGCLSSSFLMALQPAVFGEGFYKLTPFLMTGIVSVGTLYFMRALFVKLLKCDSVLIYCITFLLLFVTIQCLPEPAEALFWYNGAVHYTFMHGISLFFYGKLILALMEENAAEKRRDFIIAAAFGAAAGLGNYMSALNIAIVLFFIIAAFIIGKKFKQQSLILIPAIVFYLSFIINVAAPGNAVRAAASEGMNPLKAVLVSFYYVLDYCLGEWTDWTVLIFAGLAAALFWNAAEGVEFDFPCPLLVTLMNYCVLAAMVTPPLYGTGNIEAGRIKSLIYIMYILLLTLTVCYLSGWARKRFADGKRPREGAHFSAGSKAAAAGLTAFLLAGSLLCVLPEPYYYTYSAAAADILNGSAARYGSEMKERSVIYNSSAGLETEVAPLSAKPALLYTSELSLDSGDWINEGISRFYGLKSVRLAGP